VIYRRFNPSHVFLGIAMPVRTKKFAEFTQEIPLENPPTLEEIRVDMADARVERRPVMLVTNVGSCIALCIHDLMNKCGGLAHIMLPASKDPSNENFPYKYADTAVPTLAKILTLGKSSVRLVAKIAGGSNMFPTIKGRLLNIGAKNVEAVKQALATNGIRLLAEDVGGTWGRRVSFDTATGLVYIRKGNGEVNVL